MAPTLVQGFPTNSYPPVTSVRCSRSWRPSRRGRAATSSPTCPSPTTTAPRSCAARTPTCSRASSRPTRTRRKSLHVGEVATPELAPDEAYVAVMASSINFNTVWTSIFEPLPTFGFLDRSPGRATWAARHALPYHVVGSDAVGRRAARRLGGAQLEARRPGHDPLQLRRRPGPVGPRRLDARRQPADLGLRDELRRPRRPHRRQGQPADAQADPPHVGGGGGQRAVQLDELPHARRPARRPHEAGRLGARVGRDRRHRRLRRAVRAQRRRHAGRRRVVARQGRAAERARRARPSSTARPRATGSGPTTHTQDESEWRRFGKTVPRADRRGPRHRVRAPRPPDDGRVDLRRASAAAPSSRARRRRATWSSSTTATSG